MPTQKSRKPKALRIGLFGLFGIGNFGNDASLDAILEFVRQKIPDAKVTCICTNPDIIGSKTGMQTARINSYPLAGWTANANRILGDAPREISSIIHTVRTLRDLDFLIFPGTGILDDFSAGPLGIPYTIFRWCFAARLLGTKILFLNIGAGPIVHPVSRFFMKAAARTASYRSYRDEYSLRYLDSIGVDVTQDSVYPDVAFALSTPSQAKQSMRSNPSTIGIGVMSYTGWRGESIQRSHVYETYITKLAKFIGYLLKSKYRIRLLIGEESDNAAVCALMERLRTHPEQISEVNIISEPATSFYDVMTQIADTEVVVASRYHNVVAALMMGKPTLSLGYSAKNDALLTKMHMENYCQHIENIDVELLISQFRRLTTRYDQYKKLIDKQNKIFREQLRQQQDYLLQDILTISPHDEFALRRSATIVQRVGEVHHNAKS
jgi:polysaccharide pyruvyl transferase WcaK-like protein